MCVDVSSDQEPNNVEERYPGLLRQEFLGESERERGCDPTDFHDGHEAGADGGADLVPGSGAGDDGHGG